MFAAMNDRVDAVAALLAARAAVDATSGRGQTGLALAATAGHDVAPMQLG